MPVVQQRIIPPRPEEPSGLEKFLSTIGQVAQIGSGVADFVQTQKRLSLQEKSNQIRRENLDRFLDQFEDKRAQRTIEMGVLAAGVGAAGATQVAGVDTPPGKDPMNTVRTIGDIPDDHLRQKVREAASTLTGIPVEDVSDSFVLDRSNLEELKADTALSIVQNDPELIRMLGESTVVEEVSGEPGFIEDLFTDKALSQAAMNEIVRFEDAEQGPSGRVEIGGMVANVPDKFVDLGVEIAAKRHGVDWEPKLEAVITNPSTGKREKLTIGKKAYASHVLGMVEAVQDEKLTRGTNLHQAAVNLAEETGGAITVEDYSKALNGDYSSIEDPELVEFMQNAKLQANMTLRAMVPQLVPFMGMMQMLKDSGVKESERLDVAEQFLSRIKEAMGEDFPVPEITVRGIERLIPGDVGRPDIDIDIPGQEGSPPLGGGLSPLSRMGLGGAQPGLPGATPGAQQGQPIDFQRAVEESDRGQTVMTSDELQNNLMGAVQEKWAPQLANLRSFDERAVYLSEMLSMTIPTQIKDPQTGETSVREVSVPPIYAAFVISRAAELNPDIRADSLAERMNLQDDLERFKEMQNEQNE